MKCKQKIVLVGIFTILLIVILIFSYFIFRSPWKFREDRPIKIFWVDSYEEKSFWSIAQINGLKDSLDDFGIEYEMNVLHLNSFLDKNETNILNRAEEAKKLIDSWKPDIVFATDDGAQKYVSAKYVNSNIPWVFSAVNLEEKDYHFEDAKNVVGVFERKPILKALDFAKEVFPSAKKMTIIGNNQTTGLSIQNDAKIILENYEGFEVINWFGNISSFSDFKDAVNRANQDSEIILFLWMGYTWDGENVEVPSDDLAKWFVFNSDIPSISFWHNSVESGFLLAVESFPYDQGYDSGKLIKRILIDGEAPGEIESYVPIKSSRFINLAEAKMLDVDFSSSVLINSEVYEKFPWEKEE